MNLDEFERTVRADLVRRGIATSDGTFTEAGTKLMRLMLSLARQNGVRPYNTNDLAEWAEAAAEAGIRVDMVGEALRRRGLKITDVKVADMVDDMPPSTLYVGMRSLAEYEYVEERQRVHERMSFRDKVIVTEVDPMAPHRPKP